MYNHPIESGRLSVPNNSKYSLRQHHALHRASREFTHLTTQLNSQNPTVRQHPKNQTPTTSHEPNLILPQKQQIQKQHFSCFEAGSLLGQNNRLTQAGYQGFYRTPSTTYSLQNQGLKPMRFDNNLHRGEAQVKYSLKNIKKNYNNKSNSCFGIEGFRQQSDQRHVTDTVSQQPSIDQRITEQRNSQVAHASKYSLKNGIKKKNKPQVLLNLKYSDLACLNSYRSNTLFSIGNFPGKSRNFCNLGRFNDNGCKCDPQCFWMNRWLSAVGELPSLQILQKRSQKQWQDTVKQIERDLPRTQPTHQSFKSLQLIQMMREVLIGYAQLDSEVGYVQGMNFVAAALVYHSYSSFDALKVFYHLMKTCGYRKLFLGDLSFGRMLAKNLSQQLRRLVFDLFTHLVEEGIQLELFASSWYFSLCGSFVPLESMHFIIDKFMKKGFSGINEVLVTLLLHKKETLMELSDSQLMVEFSNQSLCEYGQQVDWQQLLSRSQRVLLSPLQH